MQNTGEGIIKMDEKKLDRISQGYKGELGQRAMDDAKKRIHWTCDNVFGDKILDIGCSQGITSISLAKEGKNVIGIDCEISRIEYAKKDQQKENIKDNLEFICDDFLLHDFDTKFDTIIMGEVLEHVFNPNLFLEKAKNLLTSNGRIIVTVPFGINPFPNHKRTYYFLELFKQINKRVYVSDVVFIESWIGFVADLSNKNSKISIDEKFIEKLENGFYKIDSRKQDNIDKVVEYNKNISTKLEDANSKINALEEKVKNLLLQKDEQKEKIDAIKEQYEQAIKAKEQSIYELNLTLNEKKVKLDALKNDYSNMSANLNKIKEDHSDALVRNYDLEYENKIKYYELKRAKEEKEEHKKHLVKLSDELSDAQKELVKAKTDIELKNRTNTETEEKIEALQIEIVELNKLLAEYKENDSKAEELRKELENLYSEIDVKNQEAEYKENSILELEQEIDELNQKLADSDHVIEDMQNRFEEIDDKFIKAQAGVETRNRRIKNAEDKISRLSKENDSLQKKLAEFNNMLYHARKLNEAYERFPSIKAYNWLRKIKNGNKNVQDVKEISAVQYLNEEKKEETVPKAEPKIVKENKENRTADNNQAKSNNNIKYDALFSEFKAQNDNEKNKKKRFELRNGCTTLKDMRVACIMDEFTYSCFKYECDLMQLTPENWHDEIEEFRPDMLFVESAWQGKEGKWHGMIVNVKPEFCDLIAACREKNIPVVFWCKEDPGWNDAFMAAAGMADFIFTTELDCVAQYKKNLGKDEVYFLHFAAQPALNNPVEAFERSDKFCFAGSYYKNYPERAEAFDKIAHYAMRVKGLDIFDRNYGDEKAVHKFPEYYAPFILGKLDPEEIDTAYKGYAYNINANSGTWTQTMFARRVFELMASNTVVAGNFSYGLKNLFGELTICTNDVNEMASQMNRFCSDEADMHRYRLHCLRKVTNEDLYEDRLDYVTNKVFDVSLKRKLPHVTVIANANDMQEVEQIKRYYYSQTYKNTDLIINTLFDYDGEEDVIINGKENNLVEFVSANIKDGYVAFFAPCDFYGKDYLSDMVMMLRYDDYDVIGKSSYYTGENLNKNTMDVYHKVDALNFKRSMIKSDLIEQIDLKNNLNINGKDLNMVSIHEFDYCEGRTQESPVFSSEMDIKDYGVPYSVLENQAEEIKCSETDSFVIDLRNIFKEGQYKEVELKSNNDGFTVYSSLPEDKHQYIYDNRLIKYDVNGNEYSCVIFEGSTRLDVMLAITCFDSNKKRLDVLYMSAGLSKKAALPEGTAYMSMALRVKGGGHTDIGAIRFNNSKISYRDAFVSKSNVLVITNIYPSYNDLYRNAFVHQRVKGYRNQGFNVNVMCFNNVNKKGYREFEGIDVITGFSSELEDILASGNISTVCIHFLNEYMWEILKKFKDKIRIIIWCHGSEIQPWWRREFNYGSEEELNKAKIESDKRYKLWEDVFENVDKYNIKFVFVSEYFKDEVFEDYKIDLKEDKYEIVHNYINTDLFDYKPKDTEQRKKVLSIRPFGSNKYANDLSVECIKMLSKEDFFDELTFHIIGRGVLFDPLMEELQDFDNVIAENKFLHQEEIAKLHKENGIFLVPTRMDSQGVSRDEAMSSGLVPVTNAVTAIPEFVDENCGILADGEDYIGMAEGIKKLYENPELFLEMSEKAAQRVRSQSSFEHTIVKEIDFIKGEQHDQC